MALSKRTRQRSVRRVKLRESVAALRDSARSARASDMHAVGDNGTILHYSGP